MAQIATKTVQYIVSLHPYTQVGLGAVSGCLTGFSVMKIGKFAISVMGAAILITKIAEIVGLVDIDWSKAKLDVQNIALTNVSLPHAQDIPSDIHSFVMSFLGGALLGVGCA